VIRISVEVKLFHFFISANEAVNHPSISEAELCNKSKAGKTEA
jgi:hypothetical protein